MKKMFILLYILFLASFSIFAIPELENCKYIRRKALRGHRALPWEPARDQSLDPIPGSARTCPRRKAGKGRTCPFSAKQDNPWTSCQEAFAAYPRTSCSGIPRSSWQRFRSIYAFFCFWRFRIVCWPRKISSCHFPGILSAPSSISTVFRTL